MRGKSGNLICKHWRSGVSSRNAGVWGVVLLNGWVTNGLVSGGPLQLQKKVGSNFDVPAIQSLLSNDSWKIQSFYNLASVDRNRSMVAVMGSGKLFTRTTRALLLGWQCGIAKLWGIHPKRCLKRAHLPFAFSDCTLGSAPAEISLTINALSHRSFKEFFSNVFFSLGLWYFLKSY